MPNHQINKKWAAIAMRAEHAAKLGGANNQIITISAIVTNGEPVYWTVNNRPIEPKSESLDRLIELLSGRE